MSNLYHSSTPYRATVDAVATLVRLGAPRAVTIRVAVSQYAIADAGQFTTDVQRQLDTVPPTQK